MENFKPGNKVEIVRNNCKARSQETRGKFLAPGDVIKIISASYGYINYKTPEGINSIPIDDVILAIEKCKCSLLTFELYGCQCGSIVG